MANRKNFRLNWIALIAMATSASAVLAQGGPPQGGFGQGGPGQGGRGQGGPGFPGGPGGPGGQRMMGPQQGPMLLLNPQVVKELKETDEQVNAIRQLLRKNGPGGQGGPGGGGPGGPPQGGGQGNFGQGGPPQGGFGQGGPGQGGPPPAGPGGQGGPGGPNPEEAKRMEEAIKKILDKGQYKRYRQIDLQVAGPRGFMRPDVSEALKLTEEQRDQIEEIMRNNRPPQGGPGGGGPGGGGQGGPGQGGQGGRGQGGPPQGGPGQGGPGGPGSDMGKFADALMEKIMVVLNQSQKDKYKEMTGAKFKLERPQGGPGQGGFGGGPGGPPNGGQGGGQGRGGQNRGGGGGL